MKERPWIDHYDAGVPDHLEYPRVSLCFLLEESARKFPNRACTIFKGAQITYHRINAIASHLAGHLAALGVKKGDRVGILMPNTPQFMMAYFSILKAGGVVVAANPLSSPHEIEQLLKDTGVEAIFVMSNTYATLKNIQPNTYLRHLIVTNIKETLPVLLRILFTFAREKQGGFRVQLQAGDVWLRDLLVKDLPVPLQPVDVGPEDAAVLQLTGGTTGTPKCVVVLHRNLVANTYQVCSWFVTADEGNETMLMAIPLFHVYGMVAGMCVGIQVGASLVMIPDPRDVKDLLFSIDRYHVTIFPGVPTLFNAINNHPDVQRSKYDLRSVKACVSGSATLLRETKEKFETLTGGKLFEGYGLSEAPTVTHGNPELGENRPGSIGLPLPDTEACIVSLEDGTSKLPPGQAGELVIRGPQVMEGYYQKPDETASVLQNGWLYTGDIAYMDADGYFYIVDRKKELIKSSGYQVWPHEVEEAIAQHPKVLEAGVAGVPDDYKGEAVKAWVVLKPGEQSNEEEIRQWCRARLAKYKVPVQVEFRGGLPKIPMVGKLLRRELVRQHLETLAAIRNQEQ